MLSPKQVLKGYALATVFFVITLGLLGLDRPIAAMFTALASLIIAAKTLGGAIG
jgi:hypothetical protein